MILFLFFTLATSLLTIQIYGFPTGAPSKVCNGSMKPQHHHLEPQPLSSSPITKFDTKWNSDNETISIQIESNKPIKGIFIEGRKMNGTEPLGTFTTIPSSAHLVKCSNGDAVTHNSRQAWTNLQLTWKKPKEIKSDEKIQFWATIVINFKTFWIVKSIV